MAQGICIDTESKTFRKITSKFYKILKLKIGTKVITFSCQCLGYHFSQPFPQSPATTHTKKKTFLEWSIQCKKVIKILKHKKKNRGFKTVLYVSQTNKDSWSKKTSDQTQESKHSP